MKASQPLLSFPLSMPSSSATRSYLNIPSSFLTTSVTRAFCWSDLSDTCEPRILPIKSSPPSTESSVQNSSKTMSVMISRETSYSVIEILLIILIQRLEWNQRITGSVSSSLPSTSLMICWTVTFIFVITFLFTLHFINRWNLITFLFLVFRCSLWSSLDLEMAYIPLVWDCLPQVSLHVHSIQPGSP